MNSTAARTIARVAYEEAPVGALLTEPRPGEWTVIYGDECIAVATSDAVVTWATYQLDATHDVWDEMEAGAGDEDAARAAMFAWAADLT